MAQWLKQSTSITVKIGPFVDDADGVTPEESLTITQPDVRLSKNGGAFAQKAAAQTLSHDENGWYGLTLDTDDTDTLGRLRVHIAESGALPVWHEFMVVPANIWDSMFGADNLQVDAVEISGDSTAADNLEAQYDGTGIAGDNFPATQSQINQVANVSGVAKRAPESYVLTTGTQSANTVSATEELDGTRHEHTDAGGEMELYYEFNIGSGSATEIKMTGYLQGNNDDLEVHGFDWRSSTWKRIGTLEGKASSSNAIHSYDLLVDMVGSGENEGIVRVRFQDGAFTLSGATLAIDQILVEFTMGAEGYLNGAVWLDTNASNVNTVRGVDGTATNPVSTIAAVNTLLASTNLSRVEVAPNSSFTLAATQANQKFVGNNWTLALGGQSVSGSFIQGANVSGIGTGASEVHWDHCHFGNVTLPPSDCESCVLEGTFTLGSAGDFFLEDCKSGVAGISTPVLDFGAGLNASNLSMRGYFGGIEIQNMGAGSGSYNMSLEGKGQLIINANCSATSTIAIRGEFDRTNNATGITLSEDARLTKSEIASDVADEVITGATHNVTNSMGRRIRELDEQVGYEGGAIWIDTVGGVAGTTVGENGTVNNPVDNITDALALAVATKRVRLRVASGSTITLLAALEGYEIYNANWSLVLNGQSISNSCVIGADVSGIATGASPPKFINCEFAAITLPPCLLHHCGIGQNSGVFTGGSAGEFVFHECYSLVPGSGTPSFVFTGLGSATGINNRAWAGGASWTLDSDCTLSHEVLAGGGTTVIAGGADVEIRGTTRSVTLTLSNGGTIQFVGITGPVTISGTATSIVNLYGIRSTLTDTSSGTTVSDLAADSTRFTAARAQALTDWIDGQRLDVILDATLAAALSCAAVVAAARASRSVTDAYCTQTEIESYFGRDNVRKWADLNNNNVTTEIEARIAEAINRATEEIDARLLGGPYTIPLEFDTMPRPIVKIAVQLAGDDLYGPRGAQDFDDETGQSLHRLRGEREAALESLRAIRAGVMRFAEDQTRTAPQVLNIPTTRND